MNLESLWQSKFPNWRISRADLKNGLEVGGLNSDELAVFRKGQEPIPFSEASASDLQKIGEYLGVDQRDDEADMIPHDLPGAGGKDNQDDDDVDMIPIR